MYFCTFLTGSSDKVHQTPPEMFVKQGERAKISCSHSIQDYNRIFWYKLSKNTQMQLLGYMSLNDEYPEDGANVKMEGSANKDKNCTLTTEELRLSSSAVYFCAASQHSATYHCSPIQKPQCYSPSHLLLNQSNQCWSSLSSGSDIRGASDIQCGCRGCKINVCSQDTRDSNCMFLLTVQQTFSWRPTCEFNFLFCSCFFDKRGLFYIFPVGGAEAPEIVFSSTHAPLRHLVTGYRL